MAGGAVSWSRDTLVLTRSEVGRLLEPAALFYGLGGVYAKLAFGGVPPLALAVGQQAAAGILLLPLAAATLPAVRVPSLAVVLSVVALAILSTSVAYLIYFHLMAEVGPTNTLTVAFLVPVFGLLLGVFFLDEPVGIGTFVGLAVVLASVTLVTGFGNRQKKGTESD